MTYEHLSRPTARPASLELLDTAAGLWLVRADGGDVVLATTTATRVFRGFVRLSA